MLDGELDRPIGVLLMDTPLLYAIRKNLIKSIESLVENGASINSQDDESPLKYVILEGSKEAIEILLKNNEDVRIKDSYGATPIHFAAISNDTDKLNLILLYFNSDIIFIEICLQTALMYASYANADISASKLIEHGIDIDLVNSFGIYLS